jgi:hypothetical protein
MDPDARHFANYCDWSRPDGDDYPDSSATRSASFGFTFLVDGEDSWYRSGCCYYYRNSRRTLPLLGLETSAEQLAPSCRVQVRR